ncbi:hypothetical protein L4C34_07785 [Vibrio profundum]|uniref:hypothetical protein n=1 Tax=Vibrio profundum TaxID=2910247 RepID=UPI003D11E17D
MRKKIYVMVQRNIHGEWALRVEKQMLHAKVTGSTNKEACQVWAEEVKEIILSSLGGGAVPWVYLVDGRHWEMASSDSWEASNEFIEWISEHNCILCAFVLSKKIQRFALINGLENQSVFQVFFHYNEAYQACLDSLTEAQKRHKE